MGLMDGIFGRADLGLQSADSAALADSYKDHLVQAQKEAYLQALDRAMHNAAHQRVMSPEHARAQQNAIRQKDDVMDAYKYGLLGQAVNTTIGIGNTTSIGTIGIGRQIDATEMDPNNNPAYAPALSVLKGMWQVKWGDRWVTYKQLQKEGAFWKDAEERLWQTDCMERAGNWYRIKE